jgi:PAS domain S-box-containing protein
MRRPRFWRSYGLALASVGVALLLTFTVRHAGVRGLLFVPAVLASASYGGLGAGLFAGGLSVLAIDLFLIGPLYALGPLAVDEAVYLGVFAVCAVLVAWLARTRSRAEEGLKEQASLLDLTHDAVMVRDANDVITFWNRGAEERYGWSSAEAVGKVSHELVQTIFPAPFEEIEAALHRTGRWDGELVHTRRDGTRIVVASRWSLQRDEEGRPAGVLETNNDVTERKEAEDALRRQANLLEQSHDAIFVWDFPGTIIYWSQGAEQLYGFSREEAIGRLSHDLLGTQHPMAIAVFEETIERDGMWSGELTHTTRDGRHVIVDSRQVLMREADGRRLVLETNRDVTERKQASEALEQAQTQLAHVTRVTMLGEITASIAHEVNQPLAAVMMNGNAARRWLAANPPNVDETRQAVQRVIDDANRAGQVIARVRKLLQRGAPERARLDINEVIRETLAFTRNELERKSVVVHAELSDDLPSVEGDRVQLQQVLVNLILNGMDAMGGRSAEARTLTIRSRRDDSGGIVVEVADRGKGLEFEQRERIFDPFYSTKPGGLGMGLAISRSIIEAHGGRIWAAPNDGPGLSVQFGLPAGDQPVLPK